MRPRCRRFVLHAAALLAAAWATAAQAQAARSCDSAQFARLLAQPGRVSFAGGRVSLVPPPGVRLLSPAERERLRDEPGDVILVDSAGTSIALWVTGSIPTRQIVLGAAYTVEGMALGAGEFRWVRRGEPVSLGGARWWLLEFERQGARGREHVWQYITGFRTGGLVVRFVTPVRGPGRRPTAASISTLRLHDCELPTDGEGPPPLVP
jgi:hypothetical protein